MPVDAWGRAIDPRSVRTVDQQRLASVRSTLDPLMLTPLRNAVVHSAWGRGKIDLPPGIAKKLTDTPVFVGSDIRESPFRRDLAKSMRVERVSGNARNQKFKVKDEREAAQQVDNGRKQEGDRKQAADAKRETDRQSAEAARGNKEAQRQTRATRAQAPAPQKAARAQAPAQPKAQRKTEQKPQGERVANPSKHEAKPPSQGASKQERKQKPPAQPNGQGKGEGGKGKGKKP
ncbi:MAG: hypothetical protein DMF70_14740 [Acidobacteria bacterium]|nr:MAG: hypothetical protein DMF70_14740 [Acidobacteriota bacterium]